MTTNRVPTLFILGGGPQALRRAKECGAVHIDRYAEVKPEEVDGGVQAHVEDPGLALILLDAAEKIYIYPEFAQLLPSLPRDKVVVVAPEGHPLCAEYRCGEPCS
ncbi:hypothetical protein [Pyrobaculum ferrireducens]|uniref:hypothetical protein n=1 Tax=Pyrobaculum ferrireducens TaxID=1104324 RepID=UPI0011E52A32|nr:hypothetical protein [Pyrobaculum ferrireducens]